MVVRVQQTTTHAHTQGQSKEKTTLYDPLPIVVDQSLGTLTRWSSLKPFPPQHQRILMTGFFGVGLTK